MLIIMNYIFNGSDMRKIINKFKSQTATQLFSNYDDFSNIINDDYVFHCLAMNSEDLRTILDFFNKFRLTGCQTIRLMFMNINPEELKNIMNEFKNNEVLLRLEIDISCDKSGDFVNSIELNKMRLIIDDIKKVIPADASNLEIITYVYNWLKKREYKHSDEEPYLSKFYSSALLTEYIVCVGFSKIFNNILSEYGIGATEYKYYISKNGDAVGHDISIVNVKDDKYGVDGLYFFDLTKDCFNRINKNDYDYSGFMMTYDEVAKDDIDRDIFDKMLLLNNIDIQDTIDAFKPIMEELNDSNDYSDYSDDEDENNYYSMVLKESDIEDERIKNLIFNLMQVDIDLFKNTKTVDFYYLSVPYAALYCIYSFILFFKNKLGSKLDETTFIDLLFNTVNYKEAGYLAAVNSYNSDNYCNTSLEEQHKYIKKKIND